MTATKTPANERAELEEALAEARRRAVGRATDPRVRNARQVVADLERALEMLDAEVAATE